MYNNEIRADEEAEYLEAQKLQAKELAEDFDASMGENGDLSDEELDDFLKQCDAIRDPMDDD
jgi:hypothetical protein